jgi:hypothetical protein
MALQRDARYPGRWTAASGGHPQGAFKNRTAPGALDGSYIEQDWANDWDGFFSSLLSAAAITPNGNVDAVGASQYYTALAQMFASKTLATTTTPGIVELATNAEMATGTDTGRTPSVAAVMSLFSKRAFNTTDYIRIPDVSSGLLLQWGSVVTGASGVTATFATPFGTVLNVVTNALQTVDVNTTHQAPTNSSVFVQAYNQAGALVSGTNIRYFAVGVAP